MLVYSGQEANCCQSCLCMASGKCLLQVLIHSDLLSTASGCYSRWSTPKCALALQGISVSGKNISGHHHMYDADISFELQGASSSLQPFSVGLVLIMEPNTGELPWSSYCKPQQAGSVKSTTFQQITGASLVLAEGFISEEATAG